jgi:uncharacterized protein (DUF433 family)
MSTVAGASITDKDGVLYVADTRVTLDTILESFQEGATPEEIVLRYPTLELAAVYEIIGHYLRNRTELNAYLERSRAESEQLRTKNESQFDPIGIRARLLERKNEARR